MSVFSWAPAEIREGAETKPDAADIVSERRARPEMLTVGVIVVEPRRIVSDIEHGMRALYVALTRSTQRLTVVHADELPAPMR